MSACAPAVDPEYRAPLGDRLEAQAAARRAARDAQAPPSAGSMAVRSPAVARYAQGPPDAHAYNRSARVRAQALADPETAPFARGLGLDRPPVGPPRADQPPPLSPAGQYPPGSRVVYAPIGAPPPPGSLAPGAPTSDRTIEAAYASFSQPSRPRQETGSNDAWAFAYSSLDDETPRLRDYSDGRISFEGDAPSGGQPGRPAPPRLVLGPQQYGLPISAAQYPTRRAVLASMSPARVAVQLYVPRPIADPRELNARCRCLDEGVDRQAPRCEGWHRLPAPAPLWSAAPGLGCCVAYYWMRDLIEPSVTRFAVRKQFPLGPVPQDRYAAYVHDVLASWCVPLKWVITAVEPTGQRVLVWDDEGREFEVDRLALQSSQRAPARHAIAAILRDYPQRLEPLFSVRRVEAPPSLVADYVVLRKPRPGDYSNSTVQFSDQQQQQAPAEDESGGLQEAYSVDGAQAPPQAAAAGDELPPVSRSRSEALLGPRGASLGHDNELLSL